MKLSFGMIFSIILIIMFLSFSFFGIKKFMDLGNSAQNAKLKDSIQSDVNKIWQGIQGSQTVEYFVPSKTDALCFVDFSQGMIGSSQSVYDELERAFYGAKNLFTYPADLGATGSFEIKHIDLDKITQSQNPFCFEKENGKIKMVLKKNFGESLVTITK